MGDNTNREILLAGALAAFTVDLLVYPLDTIKTRWQSQDFVKTYASSSGSKQIPTGVFKGLYQGVGSVILATLPAAAVFFTTYESAKTLYTGALPSSVPQPIIHAAASGTAELASCVVLTPAEVIKQNAQMLRQSGGENSGSTSLKAWRKLQQSKGGTVRGLWTGYTALAARNLPFTAIQFPMFEWFRGKLWNWRDPRHSQLRRGTGASRDGEELQEMIQAEEAKFKAGSSILVETGLINGASAALSGAIAAVLTTPTDVVKTRMMLMAGGSDRSTAATKQPIVQGGPSNVEQQPRSWQVAKQVFQEKGVRGLFRGGAFRAAWTAIGSGLYLGTYEVSKAWLKGSSNEDLSIM